MRIIAFFLILGALSACKKEASNATLGLQHTYLKNSKQVNPTIKGIWKSIGNGYYLEAREDSILLYSYTKSYCYKEKNDYLEGLLNSQSTFTLGQDTLRIYLTDYGEQTPDLQTKKDFLSVDRLPENCMAFSEMTRLDPKTQLDLYRETLEENYAFKQERGLNWGAIFESYKDHSLTTEEDLFEVMGEIATLTKDQHTKVISKEGIRRQYRVTPSALDVQSAFENQDEIKSLDEYFDLFFTTNKSNISDSLLIGGGQKILKDNMQWGKLNQKVGYINIMSFAGFLDNNFTRAQQIDSIKTHMDEILYSLKDTEAIVVDISFNFGGYDASALTIAGYFTDKPLHAYTSQVYMDGTFYDEDEIIIQPAKISFTKPVYVLMTDISRSAAENFAMMMDPLPNVTLVGTNTLGILSGMLGKSISEFYTTYSNQRLLNSEGAFFEVKGVKPDIEIVVFPKEDVLNGHMKAVRQVLGLVENRKGQP
ncbi:MAG: S41 family peptidase [Flavobacteriaceae bacterium]